MFKILGTRLETSAFIICSNGCAEQLLSSMYSQSHYIEVVQGHIFMEQNMRFGLILGRLAILNKKDGGRL